MDSEAIAKFSLYMVGMRASGIWVINNVRGEAYTYRSSVFSSKVSTIINKNHT